MKRMLGTGALAALLIGTLASSPVAAIETGQMLDKGKPWKPTATKGKRPQKVDPTTKAAGKAAGSSGWVVPVAAALAVGVGVFAAASGDNKPSSPN